MDKTWPLSITSDPLTRLFHIVGMIIVENLTFFLDSSSQLKKMKKLMLQEFEPSDLVSCEL